MEAKTRIKIAVISKTINAIGLQNGEGRFGKMTNNQNKNCNNSTSDKNTNKNMNKNTNKSTDKNQNKNVSDKGTNAYNSGTDSKGMDRY